ncbi:unnamed protein product [Vicia faba]|uniref:Reverse transcriptase domain-containing protein n=1 Tax=Vicia faba TaxID=3906 RepID=A0AAV0YD32_VICFA|nr:unnamed protein product [Vicia faba]
MKAKRGIRQGEPLSPYLFLVVMEYLQRCMYHMQLNPNFNHHSKCEKLQLTNLMFTDDILLFSRGDVLSLDLMLKAFYTFSKSTGVPLTCKKLAICHYMVLVDKIVARIRHWSVNFLSYAGRLQLIKSISFAMANYWLLCFPLPKFVIKKIDSICRSFLWTGKDTLSNKSLVAWVDVCNLVKQGGLGVINLAFWNKCTMLKLLWNICKKGDNLWVKWIHSYYIKNHDIMKVKPKRNNTWVMRKVLECRLFIEHNWALWNDIMKQENFLMQYVYLHQISDPKVIWHKLMQFNLARLRALMIFWLACHGKLVTKSRLVRFDILDGCSWIMSLTVGTRFLIGFFCMLEEKVGGPRFLNFL